MKYIKLAIAAIVIVGALFFIYVTVVRHSDRPVNIRDEEAIVRARLERDMQTMSPDVDPAKRKSLEDFFAKTSSTTAAQED